MVATPTCARRCRSVSPTSAAATAKPRRSSATIGRTTARLPLSEWTLPSSRSALSHPVNTGYLLLLRTNRARTGIPPGPGPGSAARLLADLQRLDDVLD